MKKYPFVFKKYAQQKVTTQTSLKALCPSCEKVYSTGFIVDTIPFKAFNKRFALDRKSICPVCKGTSPSRKREVPTILDYYGALVNKHNFIHLDERLGKKTEPVTHRDKEECWDELICHDIENLLEKIEAFKAFHHECIERPMLCIRDEFHEELVENSKRVSAVFSLDDPTIKRNLRFIYIDTETFRKLNLSTDIYWSAVEASGVYSVLVNVPYERD